MIRTSLMGLVLSCLPAVAPAASPETVDLRAPAVVNALQQIRPADPFPEQASFVRSDQYSFVRQGVPSLILGATRDAASRSLALDWLRNRFHQPNDDMSQPLDFEAAAQFARDQFLIGYAVTQADARPRWNAGNFFGARFGTAATRP